MLMYEHYLVVTYPLYLFCSLSWQS